MEPIKPPASTFAKVVAVMLLIFYCAIPFILLPRICPSGEMPKPFAHNGSWLQKFSCEFNIGDFAVGLFTLLLGIATFFFMAGNRTFGAGSG